MLRGQRCLQRPRLHRMPGPWDLGPRPVRRSRELAAPCSPAGLLPAAGVASTGSCVFDRGRRAPNWRSEMNGTVRSRAVPGCRWRRAPGRRALHTVIVSAGLVVLLGAAVATAATGGSKFATSELALKAELSL